ncbi:MAG TPA: hypothetical protein DCG12_09370 [Planctomycetaceae bacterium]|nr:hypothetical protein [Planctomycetaceae bacterium]
MVPDDQTRTEPPRPGVVAKSAQQAADFPADETRRQHSSGRGAGTQQIPIFCHGMWVFPGRDGFCELSY